MASDWTKQQVEKYVLDFDTVDTEKNGTLRFREVVRALTKAGYRGNYRQTKKLFSDLDINDDKVISRDEFQKVLSSFKPKDVKVMALRSKFELMDKDKSGSLTKPEIMNAVTEINLNMESDTIANLLIGLVNDDDGSLNYEEFLALYHKST